MLEFCTYELGECAQPLLEVCVAGSLGWRICHLQWLCQMCCSKFI